jgi:5'-nucleotidase
MNKPRRLFLNQLSVIAGVAALNKPVNAMASVAKTVGTLGASQNAVTVYHTNDMNGHIGSVYKNLGGMRQIKTALKNQPASGLLLDAGNFMSPSTDRTQRREVISLMNSMGYHCAALGENELKAGQDKLVNLIPYMQFSLLNCNFKLDNNLASLVKPYAIIYSGNLKIGITAVCRPLKGINYNDAIESANRVARLLKETEKCNLVICLSHLGHKQDSEISENQKLAEQSEHIDMVIAGNEPKLMINARILRNKVKHEVILAQTASDGLLFGRTIISFDDAKMKNGTTTNHFVAGGKSYAAELPTMQLAKDARV